MDSFLYQNEKATPMAFKELEDFVNYPFSKSFIAPYNQNLFI